MRDRYRPDICCPTPPKGHFVPLALQRWEQEAECLSEAAAASAWHPTPSEDEQRTCLRSMHDSFALLRNLKQDMVTIIVSPSQIECDVPREALIITSRYFLRRIGPAPTGYDLMVSPGKQEIVADDMPLANFYDYSNWLYSGTIIPHPHYGRTYAIEAAFRRLIEALRYGIEIESESYQRAALSEMYQLGPLLEIPEDHVDSIFAATGPVIELTSNGESKKIPHPGCWLIVSIAAAKREGVGRLSLKCEQIHYRTFINMFAHWHRVKANRPFGAPYPDTLAEALTGV